MELMSTRLPKEVVYTKNSLFGVSKRCDWFINGNQLVNITNTSAPRTIFLSAYIARPSIIYFVNQILPKISGEFILIIASEDCTFPYGVGELRRNPYKGIQHLIKKLLNCIYLKHIFVENLDALHDKMSPIPLGIYPPWKNRNIKNISEAEYTNINFESKTTLCLSRHRVHGDHMQWHDRIKAANLSKTAWAGFVKYIDSEISHHAFINELRKAKFCLCIHGGGIDPCPRFFECILHGVIPIIQHSALDPVFEKFPVVYISSLTPDALSKQFLLDKFETLKEFYVGEKRKNVLNLLTIDYWWNIINTPSQETKVTNTHITCMRPGCELLRHNNINNNGGTHCCYACKIDKGHGPLCHKLPALYNSESPNPL